MGKPETANSITDLAAQTQEILFLNPMAVPQITKLLEAQENALREAEEFSEHWFARRHAATKTSLEIARDISKKGSADPSGVVKDLTDWQRQSIERIAEDFQEWIDLCARCAGHFATAEIEAETEGLQEAAKRTESTVKSRHAMPV